VLLLTAGISLAEASSGKSSALAAITVDYPAEGAIFPPEITAPVFRWRDASPKAVSWRLEVSFGGKKKPRIKAVSSGPRPEIGEIDERVVASSNKPPVLTPEEAEGHTWTPDDKTWAEIKKNSVDAPAVITITGFDDQRRKRAVSRGQVTIRTSRDPVGAPIFYRDVPLIPAEGKKGIISPLPKHMLTLINWRLRDISKPSSRLLMTGVSTCVNCHSFSADGKTIGMDVDGPDNDRALYALMPVRKETLMNDASLIKWSTFQGPLGGPLRVGFMSQVSPDGKYVLTTINDPRSALALNQKSDIFDRYYVTNFLDYKFVQVFYPTRGILAWYSKETGRLQPLPGADDERFVQACGVWSPDGKYIVFVRAEARSAYSETGKKAEYANDPNETQIQYDLYRIPFNNGKGGKAERIIGASENGMSNNFPKVSPDGRWIVFVQNRNGLLMRPDSKLYIVPFEGGTARPLKCNTPLMNSWHSFSPNGRWLVFSSKGRSPYTQMYLTHIDENGNDSPAILITNATAANRAVNIPEFVNIPPDSWVKMEAPMADFFHQLDVALDLGREGKLDEAIPEFRKALAMQPGDARAHYYLALALDRHGDTEEAIAEFRRALEADPTTFNAPTIRADLALVLARTGRVDEAVTEYTKALDFNPGDAMARSGLATVLSAQGHWDEAIKEAEIALQIKEDLPGAHNTLGIALARAGKLSEAAAHLRRSVELQPDSFESQFNLGRVLAASGQFQDALPAFKKAVELSGGKDLQSLNLLSAMYSETGQWPEALATAQQALQMAEMSGDTELSNNLKERILEARSHTR